MEAYTAAPGGPGTPRDPRAEAARELADLQANLSSPPDTFRTDDHIKRFQDLATKYSRTAAVTELHGFCGRVLLQTELPIEFRAAVLTKLREIPGAADVLLSAGHVASHHAEEAVLVAKWRINVDGGDAPVRLLHLIADTPGVPETSRLKAINELFAIANPNYGNHGAVAARSLVALIEHRAQPAEGDEKFTIPYSLTTDPVANLAICYGIASPLVAIHQSRGNSLLRAASCHLALLAGTPDPIMRPVEKQDQILAQQTLTKSLEAALIRTGGDNLRHALADVLAVGDASIGIQILNDAAPAPCDWYMRPELVHALGELMAKVNTPEGAQALSKSDLISRVVSAHPSNFALLAHPVMQNAGDNPASKDILVSLVKALPDTFDDTLQYPDSVPHALKNALQCVSEEETLKALELGTKLAQRTQPFHPTVQKAIAAALQDLSDRTARAASLEKDGTINTARNSLNKVRAERFPISFLQLLGRRLSA